METRFPLNILVAAVLLNHGRVNGHSQHHRVIIHVPYRVHTIHHTIVKHVIPPPLLPESSLSVPPAPAIGPHKSDPGDWYEILGYSVGEPLKISSPHDAMKYAFDSGDEEHLQYHLQEELQRHQLPHHEPEPFTGSDPPLLGARNDFVAEHEWTPSFGMQGFEGHPGTGHLPVERHHPASGLLDMPEPQTDGSLLPDFPSSETVDDPEVVVTPVPQPWRQTGQLSSTSIRVPRQHSAPSVTMDRQLNDYTGYAVHEQVDERTANPF